MTNETNTPNVPYPTQYASLAASLSGLEIWVWVYWVRVWLGLTCDIEAQEGAGWQFERPKALYQSRAQRRWAVHYRRRGSHIADKLYVLRMMLPPGLTENQQCERLSHISGMGRVRIYGISNPSCVRLSRPLLTCYDHGWWRAPLLRACAEPLHPP